MYVYVHIFYICICIQYVYVYVLQEYSIGIYLYRSGTYVLIWDYVVDPCKSVAQPYFMPSPGRKCDTGR